LGRTTGIGGAGGGGNGAQDVTPPATNGTDGLGGGGGGGGANAGAGARGGSGVCIIRYVDTFPAAVSTTGLDVGYPVVSGGFRIYKWSSSGSITF
jgi:hypothetical protein